MAEAYRPKNPVVDSLLQRKRLAVLRYGVSQVVRLANLDLQTFEQATKYGQELVLHLSTRLVAKFHETVEYDKVPLDWWQHFKERWFPDWLRVRFPVRYRYIAVKTVVQKPCPHLAVQPGQWHLDWVSDPSVEHVKLPVEEYQRLLYHAGPDYERIYGVFYDPVLEKPDPELEKLVEEANRPLPEK